jgi:thymidylate kinase
VTEVFLQIINALILNFGKEIIMDIRICAIDGPNASGKTSLVEYIVTRLASSGGNWLRIKEPFTSECRALLTQAKSFAPQMDLLTKDRCTVEETIASELNKGLYNGILKDRSAASTVVYQGILYKPEVSEVINPLMELAVRLDIIKAHIKRFKQPDKMVIVLPDEQVLFNRLNARNKSVTVDMKALDPATFDDILAEVKAWSCLVNHWKDFFPYTELIVVKPGQNEPPADIANRIIELLQLL